MGQTVLIFFLKINSLLLLSLLLTTIRKKTDGKKMPWGKNKSYNFKESNNKQKSSAVQTTSYKKLPEQYCKDCPHRPKQISEYEESKTGKYQELSRIQ